MADSVRDIIFRDQCGLTRAGRHVFGRCSQGWQLLFGGAHRGWVEDVHVYHAWQFGS
jgi:hypothetical protein